MEALADAFKHKQANGIDYFSFKFGDGYELCFEPLFFDKMYVALYKDEMPLTGKIPIKIIDEENN